jgi:hypothetical protein
MPQTYLQCCGSGMFITDHDFYPSRIPDPKTATKERGEKISCHNFFVAVNFTKLKLILFLKCLRKNNLAQFSKNYRTFHPKTTLSKIWIWDPRSGIQKKPIPDPGSRGQKDTGSRIRNTAYLARYRCTTSSSTTSSDGACSMAAYSKACKQMSTVRQIFMKSTFYDI